MSMLNLPLHQTIVASTAAGVSSTLLGHPIEGGAISDELLVTPAKPVFAKKGTGRPPRSGGDGKKFRKAVVEDLTARRDRYCTSDVGERRDDAPASA